MITRHVQILYGPTPAGPYLREGAYQIGEVQARSWTVFGIAGLVHASGRVPVGKPLHCSVLQRQLGCSSTRA